MAALRELEIEIHPPDRLPGRCNVAYPDPVIGSPIYSALREDAQHVVAIFLIVAADVDRIDNFIGAAHFGPNIRARAHIGIEAPQPARGEQRSPIPGCMDLYRLRVGPKRSIQACDLAFEHDLLIIEDPHALRAFDQPSFDDIPRHQHAGTQIESPRIAGRESHILKTPEIVGRVDEPGRAA